MKQQMQKLLDQRMNLREPEPKRSAFWEQRPENAVKLEAFKRDYADPEVSLREMLKRYGGGFTNTSFIRRVGARLGLPPRDFCAANSHDKRTALSRDRRTKPRPPRPTVESIQAERAELLAKLKSLDVLAANLRVDVKLVSGDRAVIHGLGSPLTVDLDIVRDFVRGGGLGKLRDLVGKETGAV